MIEGLLSLIFFGIELAILITIVIFNRDHPHFWIIVGLLSLLQLYQLSEFLNCAGIIPSYFVHVGYVIITFLPPLGYYLAAKITEWKFKDYYLGFLLAIGFSLFFLIHPNSVNLLECTVAYAKYDCFIELIYGIYYYAYIVFSMAMIMYAIGFDLPIMKKGSINFKWGLILLGGYIGFTAPMTVLVMINRSWLDLVTSVLCKFAIILAVTLAVYSFIKPAKGTAQ